jgi:acyl-CoA thioester hydrolase
MTDQPFRFSIAINVRFRDIDALGHVNNAVYFTYMEQARVDYLQQLGLYKRTQSDPGIIIAEATCQYKAPIRMNAVVVVKVRVSQIGNSSFTMDYQLEDQAGGQIMALGRTVNVAYDYVAGRSTPLLPEWRRALEEFEQLA